MISAKQYKRQFLARIIPMTFVFLIFAFSASDRAYYPENANPNAAAIAAGVHPGGFSEATLPIDSSTLNFWPAPSRSEKPAGLFCVDISNRLFHQQWKNYRTGYVVAAVSVFKRYVLFSCLRLSETPLPA